MRIAALILALLLVACAPSRPDRLHFVAVVHNTTTATEDVTIRWAIGGLYVGEAKRRIAAGCDGVVVMGELPPDLVEIDSLALQTAWGPPDWRGGLVFHVSYPSGVTWAGR